MSQVLYICFQKAQFKTVFKCFIADVNVILPKIFYRKKKKKINKIPLQSEWNFDSNGFRPICLKNIFSMNFITDLNEKKMYDTWIPQLCTIFSVVFFNDDLFLLCLNNYFYTIGLLANILWSRYICWLNQLTVSFL